MYNAGYECWTHDHEEFEDLPKGVLMDDKAIEGYFDALEDTLLNGSIDANRYNDPCYEQDNW